MRTFLMLLMFIFMIGCSNSNNNYEENFPIKPAFYEMARLSNINNKLVSLEVYKVLINTDEFNSINNLYQRKISKKIDDSKKISLRLLTKRLSTYECDSGYAELNRINENEADITYHNCLINNTILNGKVYIVKYSSNSAKIDFDYLTIIGDNSEKLIIKKATFKINDNIFKIKNMYANYQTLKDNIKFLNYNQTVINDINNAVVVVVISGYIKTDCLDGYVYVKTLPQLNIQNDSSYLTGTLEISSNAQKIIIDFAEDGAYITDVDSVQEFLTYDDIENEIKKLSCN